MKKRTTQPKNNKYYIRQATGGLNGAVAGYPTIAGANVLANCVGYANGRFNEIINDPDIKGIVKAFKYQLICNAENFIESAKRQGLKISAKPTVGGIMVWQKGATLNSGDGAGHVAIVEEIYKDGSIFTSESGWGSRDWAFKNLRRNNSNGRWGQSSAYKFRGCIVNPAVKDGKPVETPKLVVDGIGGTDTVLRMQEFFGTAMDGVISGQNKSLAKYYPSLKAVSYTGAKSTCVKNLQRWVGVTQDGIIGQATVKAWQKKLGVTADGIFGTNSMKKWQTYLNNNSKAVYPVTPTKKKYKVIDVSEWQGNINFAKVKADGVVGVIIRYADGTYLDPKFDKNMKNAKAAGLHIGAYIFSRATSKAEAEKEATRIFNACKPYNCDMPLYIDLEDTGKKSFADTVAMAYLAKIKALGGTGGVYANLNWWNNYLKKTAAINPIMWVAQYYSKCEYTPASRVGMWQYSSSGSVKGISGRVDMDWCYVEYWKTAPTPTKQGYTGKYPEYKLTKTNAKAKADAVKWAKWIAGYNKFHYGYGKDAHHNGCYFCGTQKLKKGHGIKEYEYTYCCNPFVGAAWAHGAGDATAYKMCNSCNSWDFGTGNGSYHTSKLFDNLGHPAKEKLQAGDVLCNSHHVVLYLGNGKLAEAGHTDDNVINSKSWISSIEVTSLTDSRYKDLPRAYRYNGSVNVNRPIMHGEVSDRVGDLQKYLKWYGYDITADCIFGQGTYDAVKKFQKAEGLSVDGIVGQATIDAMKKVKK